MKQEIFNSYVEEILNLFRITREDLFSKNKESSLVDARQLLYYLCKDRPMRVTRIQEYMAENGYDISHSTIIYGIRSIEEKMKHDDDYMEVVNRVKRWATT